MQSSPKLNLQLSTEQGTVAPGGNFTCTLATSNVSGGSLPGAMLTVGVPAGASFVSADGGGTLSGGMVNWSFGNLAAGINTQVHVTFQASLAPNTPLGPVDATLSDSNGNIARASDTRVIYSPPVFEYILTASPDPVKLGHVTEFDLTVHNLTTGTQSATLNFTVPEYVTYNDANGHGAGSSESVFFTTLLAGESRTAQLHFTVLGSGAIPPDGASITLNTIDRARGASVSRSVVVRVAPALNLQLSTEQGTVASGGNFTYTLATSNVSGGSLPGAMLTVGVPAGASFVSADGGGTLSGGMVNWSFGNLAAGINTQVHVTFQASLAPNTPLGPVDATLSDNNGNIARASDTRVIYSNPVFEYILTATPDPVQPGHVVEFDLTVHNLTTGTESATLNFTVPEYVTYNDANGHGAGSSESVFFTNLLTGEFRTAQLHFTVLGSGAVPPDGASITLNTIDRDRGASVSRTVVVRSPSIPTPTPTGTPGGTPTPSPGQLGNISTRLRVETSDNVLIGGFIVTGTQPKRVILRAIGPSLTAVGIPGALANPTLELHDSSGLIASNDNWMDAPNRQEIIDSTLAPTNDFESAILMTLPANSSNYTAIVRGVNNGTGVGLVEAYDLGSAANSKLANISTRGLVQTGDDVMIGGFIVVGQTSRRVIVRAIGPSLSIPGKLADPTLELHDGNGALLQSNDNWRTGGQEAEIIATTIPPSNDLESAIVRTLAPGNYTAIVRGGGDTSGIAVVEAYQLNN